MAYCAALQKEFGKFKADFDLVGTHLGNAQKKYADADKHLERFETKLDRASEHEIEAGDEPPAALPRALDDAA